MGQEPAGADQEQVPSFAFANTMEGGGRGGSGFWKYCGGRASDRNDLGGYRPNTVIVAGGLSPTLCRGWSPAQGRG